MKPHKPRPGDVPDWIRRKIAERRHDPSYADWLKNWECEMVEVPEPVPDPQPDPVGRLVPEEWFNWEWVPAFRELKKWRIVK